MGLKMLDESEARRQMGERLGFPRDLTDKIYSSFQALEPESSTSTVKQAIAQRALAQTTQKWITKLQLMEATRVLGAEPPQIEFGAFLRTMKTMEAWWRSQGVSRSSWMTSWRGG